MDVLVRRMTQALGCILILYDCQLISYHTLSECPLRVTSMPQQIPRQFPKVCSGSNRRGCQSFPQTFQRRGEKVFATARNDEIRDSADNLVLVIGISPRHAADTLPNERIQSGIKLSPVALDQACYIAHPGSSGCVCPIGNLGLFAHAK